MATPGNYVFVEYPKWMYRRDETGAWQSRIFRKAEDVPPGEGWTDRPDSATGSGDAENGTAPRGKKSRRKPVAGGEQSAAGPAHNRRSKE